MVQTKMSGRVLLIIRYLRQRLRIRFRAVPVYDGPPPSVAVSRRTAGRQWQTAGSSVRQPPAVNPQLLAVTGRCVSVIVDCEPL